ncbi:MAG TPA: pyridoxal 5'-phosphate synthase [Trebonia sp.]|nr:pyridoxal 5'-phosphate synthase [Trebonia sp.]
MTDARENIRDILRAPRVFPAQLPGFDARSAPLNPVTLFLTWLSEAIRDQVLGPQAMTLATADEAGRVSSRVLLCKDVDEDGRWYFASDSGSRKGRELAASPWAALSFFWPQQGRQVRISGTVSPVGRDESAQDFLALSAASRAEALTGRQSQPLLDVSQLDEALRRAQADVTADPGLVATAWTLYALAADEAEFWQADPERRHIRLHYQRTAGAWAHQLLWP